MYNKEIDDAIVNKLFDDHPLTDDQREYINNKIKNNESVLPFLPVGIVIVSKPTNQALNK